MSTSATFPVKRAFWYSLIASVLLSAFLGIATVLSGKFGWVEFRIMLTTGTIALGSMCGLACGAYLGTKPGRILPIAGIGLAILAAAMIILGIWIPGISIEFWKLTASCCVFAVACAHLSLLSMARLADWFQWSLAAAYFVIFGVASLIVAMIFFEISETGMFQLLGVAAIVDAAMTILVPLFHRLSRSELSATSDIIPSVDIAAIDAEVATLKNRIAELEGAKRAATG